MYVCMYVRVMHVGWMQEWMDGWMDGWMGGWMDVSIPNRYLYFVSRDPVYFCPFLYSDRSTY